MRVYVADDVAANDIQVGITSFGPPLSCGGPDACAFSYNNMAAQQLDSCVCMTRPNPPWLLSRSCCLLVRRAHLHFTLAGDHRDLLRIVCIFQPLAGVCPFSRVWSRTTTKQIPQSRRPPNSIIRQATAPLFLKKLDHARTTYKDSRSWKLER